MELTFYGYPKCGTCRKAEKWFSENKIGITYVNIKENPPSREEITRFLDLSDRPIKKFFNTSGQKYRELGLKDKVESASREELIEWLASDGMLLKRPIVTDGEQVTVGFREDIFNQVWAP
ncbi:MAG TPA: arsenate reductase family protein [Bacillales bacterium]|nr:arsenate reductase family protein [Bacillales bacterium]